MNGVLYAANSNQIRMVKVPLIEKDVYQENLDASKTLIRTFDVKEPCRILGMLQNKTTYDKGAVMLEVETEDNQIDFTKLYIKDKNFEKGEIYCIQFTEVVSRDVRLDPIVKWERMFNFSVWLCGVALR